MTVKKKLISIALAAGLIASIGLAGCKTDNAEYVPAEFAPVDANAGLSTAKWNTDYRSIGVGGNTKLASSNYNGDLYFLNDLKFDVADPTVIWVPEGEIGGGYFYAYGTSDLVGGHGIQCWKSRDLTNWEYESVAYHPDFDNTWAYYNHWAPEVLYDEDLDGGTYLMIFNADWQGKNQKCLTIATSRTPYGPFTQFYDEKPVYDFSPSNPLIPKDLQRTNVIDGHLFIDPKTKDKYLYYSGYENDGYGNWHGQTIFGCKLNSWTEPDYSTVKELTHLFYTNTEDKEEIDEGKGIATVNEGAFIWYNDVEDEYYLTFSVYAFTHESYQVRMAVAKDPLGDYEKIQPNEGGQILATEPGWGGNITSAGHHCFIQCGDTLMIAYHTFKDRQSIQGRRALAIDTVSFVKNSKGQTVLHSNGPTWSYQPLPEELSGYKNVAPLAKVYSGRQAAAGSGDISCLTDNTIKIHDQDCVKEYTVKGSNTPWTITLEFEDFVTARSILIYNSINYDHAFWAINKISLEYKSGENTVNTAEARAVRFDKSWHTDQTKMMYPGATSILEFADLPIKRIQIEITSNFEDFMALNEIVVLGKEVKNPAPVTKFSDYSYQPPEELVSVPVYESETFGTATTDDGYEFLSGFGFDYSHDDGTANGYIDKTWAGNTQKAFFKDFVSTNFYVEAELSVLDHTKSYCGDQFPKIGIMMQAKNYFVFWHIDCQSTYTGQQVGYVESNAAGDDYDWKNSHKLFNVEGGINYSGTDYTKLAVARIGSKLYFFANDKLIAKVDGNFRGFSDSESTASAIGFLTYNSFTRFKNYSVTGDLDEINSKLTSLGVVV